MFSWCARTWRKLWRLGRDLCFRSQDALQNTTEKTKPQHRNTGRGLLWRIGRPVVSVASAFAALGLGWWLTGGFVGIGIISILIAHELGHFFMALAQGAQASLPFFIPLGLLVIGLTPVKNIRDEALLPIAAAGPIAGAVAAVGVAVIGIVFGSELLFWLALLALGFEVISGTIGSDGQVIREERRLRRAL